MRPVWIVANVRTGSHVLSGYLNGTGLFEPKFLEHFQNLIDKESLIKGPIDPIIDLPRYSVVHSHQFCNFFSIAEKPLIERHLPGIRYVWLRRRDLVASVVSLFIARMTNFFWTDSARSIEYHAKIPVEYRPMLLDIYFITKMRDAFWSHYLSEQDEYLTVFYEDLDKGAMRSVFDFLGLDCEVPEDCGCYKLKHPMTPVFYDLLQEALEKGYIEDTPWTTSHFGRSIPLL